MVKSLESNLRKEKKEYLPLMRLFVTISFTFALSGCIDLGFPKNDAPRIISMPKREVIAGELYSSRIEAEDLDGDRITYLLRGGGPLEYSVNRETGEVLWQTSCDDAGTSYDITLGASDIIHMTEETYILDVIENPESSE